MTKQKIWNNIGDWHGDMACKYYAEGNMDAFARHIAIADRFWRRAR